MRRIVVLGTGGTIAGKAPTAVDNLAYQAAQVGIGELLQGIPVPAGTQVVAEQFAQVDSKDMDLATWARLAMRCLELLAAPDLAGIVITHGTDTLEETAYFLHRVLAPAKPVVLTGAMRPATSLASDGPQNLADALAVAAAPGAQGVVVAFAGSVHGAEDAAKAHVYRTDAFWSGDAGPVAIVEEGQVRPLRAWPVGTVDAEGLARCAADGPWPWVEVVLNAAGTDGRAVRALVAAGVRGIVAAGTGNGTLSQGLEQALLEARDAGVEVLRTSRCPQGRVLATSADTLPAAAGSTPAKARIDLLLRTPA